MSKPTVLLIQEMKEEIFNSVNKYVNDIPAIVILDTLTDIERQLKDLHKQQLEKAKEEYKESEVEDNVSNRQEDNRTASNE